MKEQKTDFGTLIFGEHILYVSFKPSFEITPEVIEYIHIHGKMHFKELPFAIIVDFRSNVSSSHEARSYGAKNEYMHQHIAYGLVAKSLAEKLLVNFFIRFNKPDVPSRLFTLMQSCENWVNIKIRQKLLSQS